jgi:hypothetical protein
LEEQIKKRRAPKNRRRNSQNKNGNQRRIQRIALRQKSQMEKFLIR